MTLTKDVQFPSEAARLREIAQSVMPREGSIDIFDDSGATVLQTSWLGPIEADGKRHRMVPVRIYVDQDVMEDYAEGTKALKAEIETRFSSALKERLKAYKPKRLQPVAPTEQADVWRVTAEDLIG
jgi:hypothetical protein